MLLPLASWHQPLPYPPKYRAMIEEFCTTNHVPLNDFSNLLTDDDFFDHIHVNQQGLQKTDAALMDIARKFLKLNVTPAPPMADVQTGSDIPRN